MSGKCYATHSVSFINICTCISYHLTTVVVISIEFNVILLIFECEYYSLQSIFQVTIKGVCYKMLKNHP